MEKLTDVSNAALQIATVSVSPSTVTIPVNGNFTINVTVSGVSDLYGSEFQLGWNRTLLDAVNVSEGPFLKAGGSTFFTYTVNATAGNMIVDCTLLGNVLGVSGDGTLGVMTFFAKSVGECPLDLHDVILLNSLEQPIPYQAVGGYGYFTSPQLHDVVVTLVTAAPIAVLPSDIVNVNVTVQNRGGFAEVFNVTVYANSRVVGGQSVSLGSGSSTIVTFAWNTTGFGKGDYAVLASASVVPGEVNTADNTKTADDIVTILYPGHDIAVTRVEPLKTVVGQGYNINTTVTVRNYGIFNETSDTTAYINATALQTQTVTLTSGNGTKLTFTSNMMNFAYGNYTISAYALPVPGENDTTNNSYIFISIHVGVPGDVSGPVSGVYDGTVNMRDISYMILLFNTKPSSTDWKPNADVNNDDVVNMRDITVCVLNFNKHES